MASNFDSSSGPAPKLGSPEQFNRRQTRLRDLKSTDARFDLPPLYDPEEKAVQRIQDFDARLAENQRKFNAPTGAGAPSAEAALQASERAALDRDLRMQKSRARIERLKDVRTGLELVRERLIEASAPSSQTLGQLRSLIQSIQSQLPEIYAGRLEMTQGIEQVRPLLAHSVEKLNCVQQGNASGLSALYALDIFLSEALRTPNPVPVMEKAALLALAETVDRVLELFHALTDAQSASEDEILLQQDQPSLQLLQRAGRSQQEMLAQLTALHNQLGDLQDLMSLHLLKASLHQLRSRSLRELLGISEIIAGHLPPLAPLVPLLKSQHERLEQTNSPDFLNRKIRYSLAAETPDTPGLPAALQPILVEYTQITHKVLVAFEALTGQSQEKEQALSAKGGLADLDALFGF